MSASATSTPATSASRSHASESTDGPGMAAAVDAATAEELIRAHLPLVGHLVRELIGRLPAHVNRDDLTSAGMMALVTSAQGFDPSRGVPFNRFATIRIRGALTDELRSMDWASRGVRTRAREVDTVTQQLTAALGRTPERTEIATALGVAVSDLAAVEADVHRAATLSVEGMAEAAGGDMVPSHAEGPEGLLVRREQIGLLHDAIAELPDRLRVVVEQYFYGNRRMADIADELGVTESRVSQLRSEALGMLRDGMRGQDASFTGYDGVPASAGVAGAGGVSRAGAARAGAVPAQASAGPAIPAVQVDRDGARTTAAPVPANIGTRVGKPAKQSRREAAREAYVAAIASRSTLATRLAATTTLGETWSGTVEGLNGLRAAQ